MKPTDEEIRKFNLKELNYFLHNNKISRREPIYKFNDFLDHNSAEIKKQLEELHEANFNEDEAGQILRQFYIEAYYKIIPKRLAMITKILMKIKEANPGLNVPFINEHTRLSYESDI